MDKIDLKKTLKHLYSPSAKEISVVDVPTTNFLMIDGEGDPNISQSYANAVEALTFGKLTRRNGKPSSGNLLAHEHTAR